MQTPNKRISKPITRYSSIIEPRSVQEMLRGFVRLSVQDPPAPHPRHPLSRPEPLDLRSKYLSEYTTESKSQISAISKKSRKSRRSTDFDTRFLFYDRLLPVFVTCNLSNKCFFRTIQLIERALSSKQNPQLDKYKALRQSGGPPGLENAFFLYWFREIALPSLLIAIDNEMANSRAKTEATVAFLASRQDLYPISITSQELHDKKLAIFIWNDCNLDDPTHYDALGFILREREDLLEGLGLLRDVAEKVLLVNLCFDYRMFELSTETLCQAVVHFCLCSLDEAFKKFLSNASKLSQPEKNRVKTLYQALKRIRKVSKTVESVLIGIQQNFELLQESEQGLNFREWKFDNPVPLPEGSDSESGSGASSPRSDMDD